ncbi:DUF2971 domain-containing protein [Neptunomonas sp. CHC150]|uniref:DUF2971 domain-containing protein n=1 Tax=Neptunomonas sp. CHC150 TaxID=2998324 RepID=UPI0025B03D42|nr:DUF2971 domain-containing protein [Neptunomonas sp. CHC150]MDN2658634.1 DUF2971 domain-containing protein [Neptunomonas sp. CHC150]
MRVFKYRGGDEGIFIRDLESLEKDTFWSPTINRLNDPCEGLVFHEDLLTQIDLTAGLLGRGSKEVSSSAEAVKQSLRELIEKKDSVGIYSLSKNGTDELMWAHYANGHEGFCIEYELDTLVYFGRNDYHTFDVNYSNNPPSLHINDMLKIKDKVSFIQKLIGIKSKRWAHEKEIRVVTSVAGLQHYDYRAVKAIYFGLRMPEERKQEVMKSLCGRGIKYYQIHLKNKSYKFGAEAIDDQYPTDVKHLYSIAPIAEYAVDPSTLHEKWSEFSPYLHKMAEIVRREPYCSEVQMVEVSHDKSQPGKPVFFGQYQRSEYRYENMYLTPEQIDERYSAITDLEHESV